MTAAERRQQTLALCIAGDLDALCEMARCDPDDRVRASAAQYVARLAEPDDRETYGLLAELAADACAEVAEAVAINLRADADAAIAARIRRALGQSSPRAKQAAFDKLLDTSPGAAAYLHAIEQESAEHLRLGLEVLRRSGCEVVWSDVPRSLLARRAPVLAELARLFAADPETVPAPLWIAAAGHAREIISADEPLLETVAVGLCAAADRGDPLDDSADASARAAIRAIVECLPELSHWSYLALRRCDLLDPETDRDGDFELPPLAAMWLALVRLVRTPSAEMFAMQPRYR